MQTKTMMQAVLTAWLSLTAIDGNAQNLKFGKPTQEELTMTAPEKYPDADAVVLVRETTLTYDLNAGDFRQDYVVREKVKVLTAEGTRFANVSIPYCDNSKERYAQERVVDIKATAYNMVDGKVVKTPMPESLVFTERINDTWMCVKFTIPQVQAGTLLEYEYRITGNCYYTIRDWRAQDEVPVDYAHYDCTIPVFFMFNMEKTGVQPLESEVKQATVTYKRSSGQQTPDKCRANRYLITGRHLAPLKDDPFVWCVGDYQARVTAELQGMQLPGMDYREYGKKWEQIDEMLLDYPELGKRLNSSSRLKDELAQSGIDTLRTTEEKVKATFLLMNRYLSWNGDYEIVPDPASQVMKRGSGSNADLNMVLINMLHDVGVKALPVVLRTRDRGLLPVTYPSLEKLNTFIVAVPVGANTLYIDASATAGYINALPPKLYSSKARVIEKGNCRWVDLQKVGSGKRNMVVQAQLGADGQLTGTAETIVYGNEAASLRQDFFDAKDSTAFVSDLASRNGLELSAFSLSDHRRFAPSVKESFTFAKQMDATADHIYLSPFIVAPMGESPFKETERLLPVEFPYQTTHTINASITLPEGYEVEELPKPANLTTSDQGIAGRFSCMAADGRVTVQFRFAVKKLSFDSDQYEALKQIYDRFSEACQAMIVLKKK